MKNIKMILTAVAMSVCSLAAWAEGTINIPQASAGEYILIGNASVNPKTTADGVTLTGCQVDGSSATSYTVGSTNGNPFSIQLALTATAGNYLFSFKSGHAQGTAEVSLSLKNSSDVVVWNNGGENVQISNTGAWALTEAHTFLLGDLDAGTYTLTLTGVSKTGNYHGNFGNFCFHTAATLPMPDSESNLLKPAMATVYDMSVSGTYLTNISVGSYADDIYMYMPATGYYKVYAGYGYATAGTDNFTLTITDLASGIAEVNAKNYTVTDSKTYVMTDCISAGWKKIRLDHPGPTMTAKFRLEKMYFTAYPAFPVYGTSYLDLSKGTFGRTASAKYNHDPQYESGNQNIGYNGDGGYAEYYIGNTNPAGYYELYIGTSRYQDDASFTLTVTDVATSTIEVNQDFAVPSGSCYADVTCALYTTISTGLKKIRIETHSASNSHAFNYNHVCFRPIPELPVYGTSYLDLSRGTFGRTATAKYNSDPRYESGNQNIGYNGDGGYAEYYVENPENATYTFHISTIRYQESSFTLTITDLASGIVEINQDFDVADHSGYADQVCSLNNPLTTGVKKIRIETHSASNSYAFNYKEVAFGMTTYTRTHKHMNLNTLCYPYQIDTYSGATFYTMLHKVTDGVTVTDVYLQEHVGALEAGTPYFYVPEEGSAELVCHYSGDREETPQKVNGVQGAYADNTAVPDGAFVTYNNNLQTVAGGYVTLGEYRAYVDMNEVPVEGAVALLPGRKMLKIRNADAPAVTTDVEDVQRDKGQGTKVIENGVLYLKYNGTMYNVQGMRVK